jgi:uncharacterized membrane protein
MMSEQGVIVIVVVAALVVFMFTRKTSRKSRWSRHEDIHYDRDAEREDATGSDDDDDD